MAGVVVIATARAGPGKVLSAMRRASRVIHCVTPYEEQGISYDPRYL